jgi:putative oxidoreductase
MSALFRNPLFRFINQFNQYTAVTDYLKDPLLLVARLYVAQIFFLAGLTKLRDWDTTLYLFESEYQVPLLPYELAAWLGTFGEVVLPVLLVAGLLTRVAAFGLGIVNVVAVVSLAEIAPAALQQHYLWAALLLGILVTGGGRLTLDRLLQQHH